jgi:magnesium-transporting ATPase (P-type)
LGKSLLREDLDVMEKNLPSYPWTMRLVMVLALIGFIVMSTSIITAFIVGDFFEEGATLMSLPWGIVSLIDVYIGFAIFSGWIIYREENAIRSMLWLILMMVFGNATASLYVLLACWRSRGDWNRFWLGGRIERT